MRETQSILDGAALPICDEEIDAGSSACRSPVEDDGVSNGYALVR